MTSTDKNASCPFCGGRVDPEGWLRGDGVRGPECESCGATAPTLGVWNSAKSAEQHQGEPVALPAAKELVRAWGHDMGGNYEEGQAFGWNACLDEIAKLGPLYTHPAPAVQKGEPVAFVDSGCLRNLRVSGFDSFSALLHKEQASMVSPQRVALYTHADAGEVERLREGRKLLLDDLDRRDSTVAALRAQLVELPEKLIAAIDREQESLAAEDYLMDSDDCIKVIRETLSGSAEPSAPKCETCSDHGAVGNILNAEPCPDCSYSAPVERDGLEGVEDVAKSISERMKARAALERKP